MYLSEWTSVVCVVASTSVSSSPVVSSLDDYSLKGHRRVFSRSLSFLLRLITERSFTLFYFVKSGLNEILKDNRTTMNIQNIKERNQSQSD